MRHLILLLFISTPAHALIVLAGGQSGMCGRGPGGPSPLTANPLVKVWNNSNELISDGDAFISAPDFGNPPWHSGGGNNLALWFADAAADELNEEVNLVLICKGSQSIAEWLPGEEMYDATIRIYQLTGLPPADVFLWHQGEADSGMDICTYKVRFLNLRDRLKAAGVLAYDAPVILGELRRPSTNSVNVALWQLGDQQPDIYFVEVDGLADFDGTHFTGQALHDLGIRYWEQYP